MLFPFFIGFLVSIITLLFSISRLLRIVPLKEALYISFVKMLLVFIVVFGAGLLLENFIKRQFRKKRRFNRLLPEEKP